MDKRFVLALFVVGAVAVGLVVILVLGIFTVEEDGRSRDDAPLLGGVVGVHRA
jgi:hypothetical protein